MENSYTDWIWPCSTRSSVSAKALTWIGESGKAPNSKKDEFYSKKMVKQTMHPC